MSLGIILRVLARRRTLGARERWSRDRLLAHQARALSVLRRWAVDRSPLYRRLHAGLGDAPLDALPIVSKAMLMDHYDEAVVDPVLRLSDLERYLASLRGDERFAGQYWVSATSGSSGRRTIIPSNRSEWTTVIASYARANAWAGVETGLLHRVSMAVVSSTVPWHGSARVAATLKSRFVDSHRFDSGRPLDETVAALNDLDPDVLVAYASMIRILAEEQLRGTLRIHPNAVNCSSEVLTREARVLAERAWGRPPFEVYAATEAGGIAAECSHHEGLHLFEDLVIPEVVDAENRPVADGVTGDKLLVTVLYSRTLPIVRYELTDRVRIATRECTCGMPFRLVEAIEGRTDDALTFTDAGGRASRVHPVVFERALDALPALGWQVRQEEDRLRILVAGPTELFDPSEAIARVRVELEDAGVTAPRIDVEVVGSIPTGAGGKRPLVVRAR